MGTYTQFSVFLANKPGSLSQVCRALAEAKVNILALTMMDAMEHGVMRLVCATEAKPRAALESLNASFSTTEVLGVEMPNRPGAAADVCEKLASAKVAIRYMYCSASGNSSGKALGIFKVASMPKAMKALTNPRKITRDVTIKRRQSGRRAPKR